jgi:hypothetical protein
MARDYKTELRDAEASLHNMLWGLEHLQGEIAKQKRRVAALSELANIEEDSAVAVGLVTGVTDAVRTVFMGAEKPLSPGEVRDRVEALGLPPQQNLLASVHTVIRRLLESKDIEGKGDPASGGGYVWKRKEKIPNIASIADITSAFSGWREQLQKSLTENAELRAEVAGRIKTTTDLLSSDSLRHVGPATRKKAEDKEKK